MLLKMKNKRPKIKFAKEERVLPKEGDLFESHVERYKFAKNYVKGKTVLDIACGTGYGSEILLKEGQAREVVGIDNGEEAIAFCKDNYHARFYVGDARRLNFKNDTFEVVVSFETIEHIKEYELFISEVKRVLKKDGIVIMGTPNYRFELIKNKFHVSNFSKEKFIDYFRSKFREATFHKQTKWFLSFPLRGIIERIIGYERDHRIIPFEQEVFEPFTIIGVGRNDN